MSLLPLRPAVPQLRRLAAPHEAGPLSDAELLQRFALQRDEIAFQVLVGRHGPMVLGVAQAVLRHAQDAEDVFQAAYLLLARQAGSIRQGGALGGWLHRVTFRLALKRRASRERLRKLEEQVQPPAPVPPADDLTWAELREILHEELQRLPDKLRAALVLCYLEGRTQDEASATLGWPKGTLKGRLERGRKLLRGRLARRGLEASAYLLAAVVPALALVPQALAQSTAALVAAQGSGGTAASATVTELVAAGTRLLFVARLKTIGLVFVALVGLSTVGLLSVHDAGPDCGEGPGPIAAESSGRRGVSPPVITPDGGRTLTGGLTPRRPDDSAGIAMAPDGKRLATAGRSGDVRVWDALSGQEVFRLEGHLEYAYSVAFSADGKTIATGDLKQVHLWDAETGQKLRTFVGFEGGRELKDRDLDPGIRSLAFSPDGALLAAGEGNRRIRLWDLKTNQDAGRLEQRGRRIRHLAFLGDGKTLVSCADEGVVRFWDVAGSAAKDEPPGTMCGPVAPGAAGPVA